jgi:hypothetical protein
VLIEYLKYKNRVLQRKVIGHNSGKPTNFTFNIIKALGLYRTIILCKEALDIMQWYILYYDQKILISLVPGDKYN